MTDYIAGKGKRECKLEASNNSNDTFDFSAVAKNTIGSWVFFTTGFELQIFADSGFPPSSPHTQTVVISLGVTPESPVEVRVEFSLEGLV